jgi:hypothetical protein
MGYIAGMTSMNVSFPEELKEKLDALLLEGLSSGDPVPADSQFWTDLKQDALAKLESRNK